MIQSSVILLNLYGQSLLVMHSSCHKIFQLVWSLFNLAPTFVLYSWDMYCLEGIYVVPRSLAMHAYVYNNYSSYQSSMHGF